jgi:hypothetical protein
MYLRTIQRHNKDGSTVRYVQLAHNHRKGKTTQAEVLLHLGREDRLDFPRRGGHRGYAAMVEGSGSVRACRCSHSIGGMYWRAECSRAPLYQAIQVKIAARASARVR